MSAGDSSLVTACQPPSQISHAQPFLLNAAVQTSHFPLRQATQSRVHSHSHEPGHCSDTRLPVQISMFLGMIRRRRQTRQNRNMNCYTFPIVNCPCERITPEPVIVHMC